MRLVKEKGKLMRNDRWMTATKKNIQEEQRAGGRKEEGVRSALQASVGDVWENFKELHSPGRNRS